MARCEDAKMKEKGVISEADGEAPPRGGGARTGER